MMKQRTKIIIISMVSFAVVAAAMALFARAGGAGGGDSGNGGGGEGLGYLIYIIIRLLLELPFPYNIISVAIVLIVAYVFYRYTRKKVREQTIFNQLPSGAGVKKAKGYDRFIAAVPDFDEEKFKNNVRTAFLQIQQAWQDQDVSRIRRYISDGVYQRFNTQFKMMQLLKQKNTLSDIRIHNIYIDKVESDGLYDIIHVAIHASITDRFMSELDPSLNSGGREEFVEYWSFLKKRGKPRVDIYETDQCPNCGASLPTDMGEMSKCASCGTLTNSGEYDWVLSEITQADDYVAVHPKLAKSADLTEKVRALVEENEDFSVQLIEDKASNGYLQIITAVAINDPAVMRRFVSDEVFEKVKAMMGNNTVAYNRIFLNDVYLIGVSQSDGMNHLSIAIKSSFQRVRIQGSTVTKIDPAVRSQVEVVVMSRDVGAPAGKGSIYAHVCSGCGAPVQDSLNLTCSYCGSAYNSTANDWIITKLMSVEEYEAYRSANASSFSYQVNTKFIDKLYDVRDFALNNVMVMIASDGAISPQEQEFLENLASKWGYNKERIAPLFTMAANGSLVIRMPGDQKQRRKIYLLMKKAADIDENITSQEQTLLEGIKKQYRIEDVA